MNLLRQFLCIAAISVAASMACAQTIEEDNPQSAISTQRDDSMFTTHDAPAVPASPQHQIVIPFGRGQSDGPTPVPFGQERPAAPSGPRGTMAVPVLGVDSIEASEAAPPEPIEPEADPTQADPAEPTDLTSPIFEEEKGAPPRKVTIRALNKVTAQSELLTLKTNEKTKFGQLEITAVTCRISSPTSQTDYAALLDISEHVLGGSTPQLKPLFRGWMYASSPSITALEHPVYDVTMVECADITPAKKEEKSADKGQKSKESKPADAAKKTDKKTGH